MAASTLVNGLVHVNNGLSHEMSEDAMRKFYGDWAQSYDKDTDLNGYKAVRHATEKFLAYLEADKVRKDIHIMDLGAGTGKVAEILVQNGYTNIDAEDICTAMLEIAKKKGIYKNIICEGLGEKPLPVDEKTYDAVICVGVFTVGHVKPAGFDEAARITKPGGLIVFTVRKDAFETKSYGYEERIAELSNNKTWSILEQTEVDYMLGYTKSELRTAYLVVCRKL